MLIVRRVPRTASRAAAALTSAESVTALLLAHTAAGGALPSLGWLVPAALASYAASRVVLARRASIRVMLPVLMATQLFLHAWLVVLAPSAHGHGAHHSTLDLLGLGGPMLWAHLAAGAVTALVWLLRTRAFDVVVGWVEPARPLPPRLRHRPADRRPTRPPRTVSFRVAPTRGPPVVAASCA